MNFNGTFTKHLHRAFVHILIDGSIFLMAFILGTAVRLPDTWPDKIFTYLPGLIVGTVLMPCTAYILSLYAPRTHNHGRLRRALSVGVCMLIAISGTLAALYFHMFDGVGRGVLGISAPLAYMGILAHHWIILAATSKYSERFAYLLTSQEDFEDIQSLQRLGGQHLDFVGVFTAPELKLPKGLESLGTTDDMADIIREKNIDLLICSQHGMQSHKHFAIITRLRYSGKRVMPLMSVFEESNQYVPHELLTTQWLLEASGIPHVMYIKKAKRLFDVVVSLVGLLFALPLMAFAFIGIKLSSPGPVFYRQVRCGRFSKPFTVFKLRTMHTDAEKDGAVWSSVAGRDPRAFAFGAFLRKYRIDEVPQMLNVLRGEMSFVGPRPERPEFVKQLAEEIDFYDERHMVQPGITGWAQVCYPYGASTKDARRKLEYDLYYMKHMSLFMDLFILLDTVRTVLFGGVPEPQEAGNTPIPFPAALSAAVAKRTPLAPEAIPASTRA